MTADETLAALGLPSRAALSRLARVEGLPACRVTDGNGAIVFMVEDVAEWLRGRRVAHEGVRDLSDRIAAAIPRSP